MPGMSEYPPKIKHWWYSSEGLKKRIPELQDLKGWDLFAARYDDREATFNRWEAMEASKRKVNAMAAEAIDRITDLLGQIPRSSVSLLFSNDPETLREKAIDDLAEIVGRLFDSRNSPLLREIAAELEQRKNPAEVRKQMLAEGLEAFLSFILRERRLPNRDELNLEANRRKQAKWESANFGTAYRFGDKLGNGYVFSIREGNPKRDERSSVQVCHADYWNEFRWDYSDLSRSIIGPAGLKSITRKKRTVVKH